MSTFVIGDVQGCAQELEFLLQKLNYQTEQDHLWFAGDLINRGPDNVAVMDRIMNLPNVVCVLGNHDLHFLAVAEGQQKPHRSDTFEDLLNHRNLPDYIAFLRKLPLIVESDNEVLVHAGLPPQLTVDRCVQLAREVESVLQSDNYVSFLEAMYGNEPSLWREDLTGMERLRLITNYLTRLRYCTIDGQLELTHKADIRPEGFAPWFEFKRPDAYRILFGHWAALEGQVSADHVVALDTGCVWGRSLTALHLEENELISVPAITEHAT